MRWVNAGHMPPLLVVGDRLPHFLEGGRSCRWECWSPIEDRFSVELPTEPEALASMRSMLRR